MIPIGFFWNGEHIVVSTATTSPKALPVRGRADLETVDGVPDEYLAASANTLDASAAAEFERNVRSTYEQMVRISIEPRWARFYDFGAGRMLAFLTDLTSGPGKDA